MSETMVYHLAAAMITDPIGSRGKRVSDMVRVPNPKVRGTLEEICKAYLSIGRERVPEVILAEDLALVVCLDFITQVAQYSGNLSFEGLS